jgi:hypothetical protein
MLMKTVGDGAHLDPSRAYRGIALVERFIEMQPEDAWVSWVKVMGFGVKCWQKNARLAEPKKMFPSEKPKKEKTCQYNVNIDQTCRF